MTLEQHKELHARINLHRGFVDIDTYVTDKLYLTIAATKWTMVVRDTLRVFAGIWY